MKKIPPIPRLIGKDWDIVSRELQDFLNRLRAKFNDLSNDIEITTASAVGLSDHNSEGGGTDLALANHTHKREVRVQDASGDIGTRQILKFIGGVITDDSANDRITVTLGGVTWSYVTLRYSDFSTAGTTRAVNAFSIPAAAVIQGLVIKTSTAFAGTGITGYTLKVGTVSTADKYLSTYDAFAAVSDTNFNSSMFLYMENFGASTTVQVTATSTGANLNQATAGQVDVWIGLSGLTYPTATAPAWSSNTWFDPIGIPYEQAPG